MIPVKRASESGCEFRRNHTGTDHKQPIGRFRILISPLDEILRRIGRAKFESRSREEESAKHVDHLLPTPLVSPPLFSSTARWPPSTELLTPFLFPRDLRVYAERTSFASGADRSLDSLCFDRGKVEILPYRDRASLQSPLLGAICILNGNEQTLRNFSIRRCTLESSQSIFLSNLLIGKSQRIELRVSQSSFRNVFIDRTTAVARSGAK